MRDTALTPNPLASKRVLVAGHRGTVGSADLAAPVFEVVGFRGTSEPAGMSGNKLRAMGWSPRIRLKEGIAEAYARFLSAEGLRSSQAA